jgi:glycerophosphoryl diester phosphodiesterase
MHTTQQSNLQKLLKPLAIACGSLLLCLLSGCDFLQHTSNLSAVMEAQIGRSDDNIPAYRCTLGAHRGASVEYLENSPSALIAATQDPRFAFIEFDVQYTEDGQIVVFHDKRLLRLYGKFASVGKSTYSELLKATDGQIARYDDIMDLIDKKVNIEIKSQGDNEEDFRLAEAIIADMQLRGREKDLLLSSISSDVIRDIKAKHPSIPTGQIYWISASTYLPFDTLTKRLYRKFSETQADYLMLHVANLRNIEDLLKLKPQGKTILFWDFDDNMYLVQKNFRDRLWGTSVLTDLWQRIVYKFT